VTAITDTIGDFTGAGVQVVRDILESIVGSIPTVPDNPFAIQATGPADTATAAGTFVALGAGAGEASGAVGEAANSAGSNGGGAGVGVGESSEAEQEASE